MPRQQTRVPYLAAITLEFSSGKREARISDLSVGGCYVDSIAAVTEGEAVVFDLALPGEEPLHLAGTVAYVFEGNGFGVKFAELSQSDTTRILILIKESRGL